MKKLLIVALLMLALVITAVACTEDPVEPGTSAEDVTTAETPTEAPDTDEPDTPAPDTDEPETPAPDTNEPETPAPDTDEPDTKEPETSEPAPSEPTVTLDKTEYLPGESIMISATGSDKDWVGIAVAGGSESIRWWYVADVGEGVAIDALNDSHIQAGTGAATGALPAGEYEVVWVANDQALAGADKVYRYKFTIKDPSAPVLMLKPEDLNTLAGAAAPNVNQLGSSEVITEGSNTFVRWTAAGGDPYVAIIPLGSSYTLPQYMAIRYRTNSAVEGQFFVGSGAGWTGSGDSFMVTWAEGDWNFVIVDLTQTGVTSITDGLITYARMDFFAGDSAEGDYFDVAYVGVFNTAEDALKYDFEQYPPFSQPSDAGMKNSSFDTFYVNGQMYFPEDGNAGGKLDDINNTLTFASAAELQSITLRGWIGFDQPMDSFGYYVDNYEFVYGEFKTATEDGVLGAGGEFASRFEIKVPLEYLEGDDHFVGFVVKLADGTVVRLRNEITIDLPELPKDITDSFVSDVNAKEVGTTMDASDLANFFVTELPLPGSGVEANGEGKLYHLTSINDMYADVNGRYFIKANVIDSNANAWMFVRGYKVVNSDEIVEKFDPAGGLYKINNYYETDSAGAMGGAGIYARLQGGSLFLMIKYYNPEVVTRVGNKMLSIEAAGSELTLADDGFVVSVMVDGVTYATIELSGSKVYEDINEVNPAGEFAEKAVITLKDGTVETIENTLIAATCESQVGFVSRAGSIKFDSVAVGGYSAIDVPALDSAAPEEPVVPEVETLVIPQDQWVISGHCTTLVGKAGHDNSPMVAAGGVDSAALLHQGSIALGEIDLSKYSKVVIMWGSDNGPGTQDLYAKNEHNRFALVNADKNMVMSPAEDTIIAAATYELHGWAVAPIEIDLTGIDYNGPVFLTHDSLAGGFALVYSIEFFE